MRFIPTAGGNISSEELGKVLIHEHFLYGYAGFQGDASIGGFDENAALNKCLNAAMLAKSCGITTIIDATTNECGRNVRFLRKIYELTGMNIICSTGYYFEAESSYAYWNFRSKQTDIIPEIYDMFIRELTVGIDGTDIRAGVIKLASGYKTITPMEEKFFRAAARAQKETGCNIITHTQTGTMGPEQARLLISEGADPSRIAIGHMCGNTDLEYHRKVLEQGVYINLDRFGLEGRLFSTPFDPERIDLIEGLLDMGYEDRIMLGHDYVMYQIGRPNIINELMKEATANYSIDNLVNKVVPEMQRRGISDKTIDKFFTDNPKRFFG